MYNKIKFAIAGCGNISRRHATEASNYGTLVAVCDIVPEKAKALADEFNCNYYISLDALLANEKEVDAVCICTPNYLHAPQSIQCLQYGAHVLCEKPMALTGDSAQMMIDAAAQAGKRLFVVKQNRYNPLAIYVKDLITNNKLGAIFSFHANCFWNRSNTYYQNWRGKKEMDGGTLFTQFSHYIDLITWFFGYPQQASLWAKNFNHPQIEFEDTGIINFIMLQGILGSMAYTVNAYKNNIESSISIFAEKGTIKIGGQYLNSLDYFEVEGIETPEIDLSEGPNIYGTYKGSMGTHHKVYENLIKALQDPSHTLLEGAEGIKTVQLIEYLYKEQL